MSLDDVLIFDAETGEVTEELPPDRDGLPAHPGPAPVPPFPDPDPEDAAPPALAISRADTEADLLDLTELTLSQVGKIGRVFAQSGYFKDARDANQAIVKVLAGQEIGIPPFQAVSQFHVVDGKPTMSAGLLAALVKRSRRYTYRVLEHSDKACRIAWRERAAIGAEWEELGESSFTIEQAQRAKLTGNPSWIRYPEAMLFARALTAGVRTHAPDVVGGAVYDPSELGRDDLSEHAA